MNEMNSKIRNQIFTSPTYNALIELRTNIHLDPLVVSTFNKLMLHFVGRQVFHPSK